MRSGYVYQRPPWAPVKSAGAGSCWPTTTEGDSKASSELLLPGQAARLAERWTTPSPNLFNEGNTPEMFEARRQRMVKQGYNGNGTQTPLPVQAAAHSHQDQQTNGLGRPRCAMTRSRSRLTRIATSGQQPYKLRAQQALRRLTPRGPEAARLNAWFVEWLMGWPRSSTVIDERGFEHWVTAWSLSKQKRRSGSSRAA